MSYTVLLVDDSAIIRSVVSDALNSDGRVKVLDTAHNGQVAVTKLQSLKPDAVIMDVEMPVMNGLQALKEIRKTHQRLPVIMFSTLTDSGAKVTLEALSLGATDYVAKPSGAGNIGEAKRRVQNDLIPKILACCERKPAAGRFAPARNVKPLTSPPRIRKSASRAAPRVVAMGASTGGPNALERVVPMIPGDFALPLLLVQHMPPIFTKHLAKRLDAVSEISISEAVHDERVKAGHMYIAPGDYHMEVVSKGTEQVLKLTQGAPENYCRPAIDVLFRSVASVYGGATMAVLLTGMGKDGLLGTQKLVELDAQVLAQDEDSSVVWGIPGSVVQAGLADKVLPLDAIAQEVARLGSRPLLSARPAATRAPGSGRLRA